MTEKIGPWRAEDYQSFLRLDVVEQVQLPYPPPNTWGGLLGLLGVESWPTKRAGLVDQGWETRKAHPVYRQLLTDQSFLAAWRAFQSSAKRKKSLKAQYLNSPFLFLREFVRHAGFMYQFGHVRATSKYGPTKKRRDRAEKLSGELLGLLDQGVRLRDYMQDQTFRALLTTFVGELSATPRKEYGGVRSSERWVLKSLASSLLMYCDCRSAAVLTHFADMVNAPCDAKTAQRYFKEAAIKHRTLLATALSNTGNKVPISS